ncbi:hypothetical protein BDR26DRAFT_1005858 [Obelidium mucronatum]|nr:hypothetical protein BDR26DRAFT_1005858 [Obelidium mucronatum]
MSAHSRCPHTCCPLPPARQKDKKPLNPLQEQQKAMDKSMKEFSDKAKLTVGAAVTTGVFAGASTSVVRRLSHSSSDGSNPKSTPQTVTAVGVTAPLAAAAAAAAGKLSAELVEKTVKMLQSHGDKALKAVGDIISFFAKAFGFGELKLDFKKLKDKGVAVLQSFADNTLGQIQNNAAVKGLVKAVHGLEDDAKNVRNLVDHIGNAAESLEKGAKNHIDQGVLAADREVEQQRIRQQQEQLQEQKDHELFNNNDLATSSMSA